MLSKIQSQDGEVREIYVNIGSMHARMIHSLSKHDPGIVKERSLWGQDKLLLIQERKRTPNLEQFRVIFGARQANLQSARKDYINSYLIDI